MVTLTYTPSDYDIFLGIDTDKKSFAFTALNHENMKISKKINSNPDTLLHHVEKRYPNSRVLFAYEAGPTGYHLFDRITKQGFRCLVVSPNTVPKAANSMVKNNRIDSEKIAEGLKSGSLKSIRVPDTLYRELRHLVKTRDNYVAIQRTAKQRIKSLLLFENLHNKIQDPDQRWTSYYLHQLQQLSCSAATRKRLDALLSDLQYARGQMASIQKDLKDFCKTNPQINRHIGYLQSIPGIGLITATYILAKLGNPEHLRSPLEIASFMGLTPTEYSTGDKITRGAITHMGDSILRNRLVEAAWVAIRYDKQLEQFYHRIRTRNAKNGGAQKAIVAVARKLTQRIYAVLKEQKNYEIR